MSDQGILTLFILSFFLNFLLGWWIAKVSHRAEQAHIRINQLRRER